MSSTSIRERIHKENMMSYAKLKNVYGPAAGVETKPEDHSGVDRLTAKKSDDKTDRQVSMLRACIRDRIHQENMKAYANLGNLHGREATNVQDAGVKTKPEEHMDIEPFLAKKADDNADREQELSMLSGCIRERIHKENLSLYASLGKREEKRSQLNMLNVCIRDRIHQENMKAYANLGSLHGREETNVQDAGVESKPEEHLDIEPCLANKADDNADREQELSMLSGCIRERIHKENLSLYASLGRREEKRSQLSMLDACVRDRIHTENKMLYANLRNTQIVEPKIDDPLGFDDHLAKKADHEANRQLSEASTTASEDESTGA